MKKAKQEILNVDRAALRVFIGFSQAAGTSFASASETFAPDVIVSFPHGFVVTQSKMNDPEDVRPEFYEPITYGWTRAKSEMRQAAKRFSDNTHADY